VPVPSGRYDADKGEVVFAASHFSQYAVAFVHKTFADTDDYAWVKKAIEVLASKGVINGTSPETYNPSADIKRADFIVLLTKALGLTAEAHDNFADVDSSAYYFEALGIAKKLGIAHGVGGNRFNPGAPIFRQDMMVLIDRAMAAANHPLTAGTDADLAKFADRDSTAAYAKQSAAALVRNGIVRGSGAALNPLGNATRAETAVLIYRIYQLYYFD